MATQWQQLTRTEPRSWLLSNNQIINEPALEETSTGLKIRVRGNATSFYSGELESMLEKGAKDYAQLHGLDVWIETTRPLQRLADLAINHPRKGNAFKPEETPAWLHLLPLPNGEYAEGTYAWWRFKDPASPFEVLVYASMRTVNTRQQNVALTLCQPANTKGGATGVTIMNPAMSELSDTINNFDTQWAYKYRELVRDDPPEWASRLGYNLKPHPRVGVKELLDVVRHMEQYDEIQVFDTREMHSPSWLTLELYETNVNAAFISDLTEYLDNSPLIDVALEHYTAMIQALKSAGISVEVKQEDSFTQALLTGQSASLSMKVYNLAEEEMKQDANHKLSVHLPTGCFIVECTHKGVSKDEVADAWEASNAVASLTGRQDELLAYARAYAQGQIEQRRTNILAEHRVENDA